MYWSDYFVLGIGLLAAAVLPTLLVKAVKRQQWYRIPEIIIAFMALGWQVFYAIAPAAARYIPSVVHIVVLVVYGLLIANFLGLSRWIFGYRKPPAI
jgi:hypothetical protein